MRLLNIQEFSGLSVDNKERFIMDSAKLNCSFITRSVQIEKVGLIYQLLKTERKYERVLQNDCSELFDELDVDINYLKALDPKDWKNQDHYAVLGLGKSRFDASDEDIRRAFKKIVLQHHPDKRKAKGEKINTEHDYFTCITKAYEILGTPKTRRSYDSVDPEFDDSFPTQTDVENDFFVSFRKYFSLNARWSEKKNVPLFGDENSKREDVDQFYNFWYDFKSWREFSYLDEEDKEKGQDRDERRWIEKENKAARIKRKKEEMLRIRTLVDLAYNNDKRIQKFKNEEKEKKMALKKAKMDAAQAIKAEQERAFKEALLAKEKAEKVEQKRIEQIRIEKEQMKKALKKERKVFRDKAKECNYFSSNEREMLKNMEGIEKICEIYNLCELQSLNKELELLGKGAFCNAIKIAENKIQADFEETNLNQKKLKDVKYVNKTDLWNIETIHLLIKAVNLFPAGTAQRWEVIATFLNQHSSVETIFNARDVLNKAKALQNSDFSKNSLKTQANEGAFESFEKKKKDVQTCLDITVTITDNTSFVEENDTHICVSSEKTSKVLHTSKTWTKEEQQLLEQAIKTFPISIADRWDRIAECVPNRSKKDCLRRVKELVDLVNSKKEAQQAVK